jgi:hypothetical protein
MRPVNAAAPERTTSSKEALQQFHDDKLLERAGASPAGATGDAEVI